MHCGNGRRAPWHLTANASTCAQAGPSAADNEALAKRLLELDVRIDNATPLANLTRSVQRQTAEAAGASVEDWRESVLVSLSSASRNMSAKAQEKDKNKDIDESDLPSTVRELLKMIRELKAQIAEKQAELQALMTDAEMDPEAKRLKIEALRTELSTLNGALSSASATLTKVMRESGLSKEQMQQVATLLVS